MEMTCFALFDCLCFFCLQQALRRPTPKRQFVQSRFSAPGTRSRPSPTSFPFHSSFSFGETSRGSDGRYVQTVHRPPAQKLSTFRSWTDNATQRSQSPSSAVNTRSCRSPPPALQQRLVSSRFLPHPQRLARSTSPSVVNTISQSKPSTSLQSHRGDQPKQLVTRPPLFNKAMQQATYVVSMNRPTVFRGSKCVLHVMCLL